MCRSKNHGGGRRCPSCGSYAAAARANANRRLGRLARKKVVDHLKDQGLVETAAAVQAAPPSMLQEFMEATGIDPEILGDTPLPSTHSKPPSAAELVALANAERAKLAPATPAQKTLTEAEQRLAAAQAEFDAADAELTAIGTLLNTTEWDCSVSHQEAFEAYERAEEVQTAARLKLIEAEEQVEVARFLVATEDHSDEDRDAYYASLTDEQVEILDRHFTSAQRAAVEAALAADGSMSLDDRDRSIYQPGMLAVNTGSETIEVEGRMLDAGTGFYRRGPSDFVVVQRVGDEYHVIGHATSKASAIDKGNRVPAIHGIPGTAPAEDDELGKVIWALKRDTAIEVARAAADGKSVDEQQMLLASKLSSAPAEVSHSIGGAVVRAEIAAGAQRHRHATKIKAAEQAGEKARVAALADGASTADAEAAYNNAYRRALGTRTLRGAYIPHFDHPTPPPSLGAAAYDGLCTRGVRAGGRETAADYPVIADRSGDRVAWGFTPGEYMAVKPSNIKTLTEINSQFVDKVLSKSERAALSRYTSNEHTAINAAITGRDPNPTADIKATATQVKAAFAKFKDHNPNTEPMTLLRGTRVPSSWTGTPEEYMEKVFTVGSKVEIGKITSFTTSETVARGFTGHPPVVWVVHTRDGIPVKSISYHGGEDEVIVPLGTSLRCVRVDKKGLWNRPTVYLVAEDLVAEAQDGVDKPKQGKVAA